MVSECRRYIFGYFDVLPRNIISWNKIHQLILLKEMPENFELIKYLSKFFFFHLPWWSCGRVPSQANLKVSSSNHLKFPWI